MNRTSYTASWSGLTTGLTFALKYYTSVGLCVPSPRLLPSPPPSPPSGGARFFCSAQARRGARADSPIPARAPPPRCGACVARPGDGFQYLFTFPVSRFFLPISDCQTEKEFKKKPNSRLHGIRPQKQHEGRQSSDGTAAFNCQRSAAHHLARVRKSQRSLASAALPTCLRSPLRRVRR